MPITPSGKWRWSEADVVEAVRQKFYPQPWLFLAKFRPGTGTGTWSDKEFDAFTIHPWPSEGFDRHVIEAKISRSDFLKEVKDPLKKRAGLYCARHFWFAAPAGVVRDLEEIPVNCGYYKVGRDEDGSFTGEMVVPAPELADEPPTWNLVAAAIRRILGEGELAELRKQLSDLERAEKSITLTKDITLERKIIEKKESMKELIERMSKGGGGSHKAVRRG